MKKLFLIVFIIHFSIAMWILSLGEMTAYILFGFWETPIFSLIETTYPRSGPAFSMQDFLVAILGALFWSMFFVIFRWTVKKVANAIENKLKK